jgi:hypothetical protein
MTRHIRNGELGPLALVAAGMGVPVMSVGGYVLGEYLGVHLAHGADWGPYGLILGLVVSFWDLYRVASRVGKRAPLAGPPPENESEHREE